MGYSIVLGSSFSWSQEYNNLWLCIYVYYACICVLPWGVCKRERSPIRRNQAVLSGSHRYSATCMQMWAPLGWGVRSIGAQMGRIGKRTAGGRQEDSRRTAGGQQEDGRRTAGGRQEDGRKTAGGRQEDGRRTTREITQAWRATALREQKSCSLPARPQRGHRC